MAQDSVLSIDPSAFVVNSFSKYFGMTGWRLGWMVVPPDAVKIAEKLSQNLFICPSSVAQHAALGAFGIDAKNEMERNKAEFKKRRDFLVPALRKLGFGVPLMPEALFMFMQNFRQDLAAARRLRSLYWSSIMSQLHRELTSALTSPKIMRALVILRTWKP